MSRLDTLRARIDELDEKLVETLAERMAVVDTVAEVKGDTATVVVDHNREREVLQRAMARARARDLDPKAASRMMREVIACARERQSRLRDGIQGPNMVVTPPGIRAYPITVGQDALTSLAGAIPSDCTQAVLIADDTVAGLYAERIREALAPLPVLELSFPPGEPHKNRATKERIEDAMLAAHVDRHATVVGLGGGVSTDLAGFVAATFERGLPWIALPTTLLGAVDASVGGKVGVNTPAGKNLVGAFHHPRAVITDVGLFATLPDEEWANGLGEMLKHAVVADGDAVAELCERAAHLREPATLAEVIRRSVAVKARVVSQDPHESDLRQVLNFGHTIGHALEAASDFALAHGLAVAIGVAVEAEIAVTLGILASSARDRIVEALERLGLPSRVPPTLSLDDILERTRADKKGRSGTPRYVLPADVGTMAVGPEGYGHRVPDATVRAALELACGA